MENFNKNLASIKPPIKGVVNNKSNNENKLNPELGSKLKSPRTKQLPTFMNPTISASIKASAPKRKILGDKNETLDTLKDSSFGSSVVDSDDEPSLQPYDPVKNYLSPRPQFLRYNPDRRRKILNLQETDDRVKISTCFDDGLQSVEDSCSIQESVESKQESVEEADDVNDEEDEECESEDEDEDDEFGEDEDGWFSFKVVFKFLLAVAAVILTAHAICSMESPSSLQSLDRHARVYGLNVSEVGYGPVMEPVFFVGRLKQDVFETVEEFVEVQDAQIDEVIRRVEAEYDDSNVIENETTIEEFVEVQNAQTDDEDDGVHQDEVVNDDSNVIEEEAVDDFNQNAQTDEAENDDSNAIQDEAVEDIINQDGVIQGDAADANDIEIANEMENELDDIKTSDSLIKITTFNLTVAVLVGHMLIFASLGAIYISRRKKVEKEEFKSVEPSTKAQSLKEEEQFVTKEASLPLPSPPLQNDIISHVHNIPSVELLGEFVFGEETTSKISSTISSQMEISTGDSHTVKKSRRKNAEVVTPSPVSVRRSSRIKTRTSVMSP